MFSPAWRMVARLLTVPVLLLCALPAAVNGQEPTQPRTQGVTATLTLDEAIALAKRNNPEFLTRRNDEAKRDWAVRSAYGALMPSAGVSGGLQYQASGQPRFGSFTGADVGVGETPDYYFSDYSLGFSYRLDGATILRPGQEKANRRAFEAGLAASEFDLSATVTRQYVAVLRARDAVVLSKQELARAEDNLRLAKARVAVGAAIALEEKQAEVERGRAEVSVLQSEASLETQSLRLLQGIGVELDQKVELTTNLEIFALPWDRETLAQRALSGHPTLNAFRAMERAADAGFKSARTAYLPTLQMTAGWSGFTREAGNTNLLLRQARDQAQGNIQGCQALNEIFNRLADPLPTVDCFARYAVTPDVERAILEQNNAFPFDFSRQPASVALRVDLPIFTGFSRQHQVEVARDLAADARHQLRGEELRIRADVNAAYLALQTAERTVRLEERNKELADAQLRLARERYRVGAANFLELSDAETIKARADRAYLEAVYSFHDNLALLEAAVGQRLRNATESR